MRAWIRVIIDLDDRTTSRPEGKDGSHPVLATIVGSNRRLGPTFPTTTGMIWRDLVRLELAASTVVEYEQGEYRCGFGDLVGAVQSWMAERVEARSHVDSRRAQPAMTNKNEFRFRLKPDAVFTVLDEDTATILHLVSKRYFTLNDTGLRIWELMEDGCAPSEIAVELNREFEITVENAEERVRTFIEDLRSEGLVEFRDER